MKIKTWSPDMSLTDTKDLAYWERNVLALKYAEGWYNDFVESSEEIGYNWDLDRPWFNLKSRYDGWRRVLSLEKGAITFHIPDDFDVGSLPEIERNWDGHTTEEKWARILKDAGVAIEAA